MALSDRDYWREQARAGGFAPPRFTWTLTLIAINVSVFLLQDIIPDTWEVEGLAISSKALLSHGYVWTLLTYSFFHDGFWHLFFNMFAFWMFGKVVENEVGYGRFLITYFGGIILGGVFWVALTKVGGNPHGLVGASAGVSAVIALFFSRHFEERLRFMLHFFIPISLRGKWLLSTFIVITLVGLFLAEIPSSTGWWSGLWEDEVAYSAHLGGLLFGIGMVVIEHRLAILPVQRPKPVISFRQTVSVQTPTPAPTPASSEDSSSANAACYAQQAASAPKHVSAYSRLAPSLKDEVNRILDKINTSGINALTSRERNALEKARDTLTRK
ncbi:MAG: rhomboid family intramembrane serine protease [Puniceicoccales bacterium]|jgi:membrane associated rhomboid family serine protease|nr:rhomboid family intramembrane serine protease [Puniceicoccales bacterium]